MWEKIDERTNLGPILNGPFLLNLCHSERPYQQPQTVLRVQQGYTGLANFFNL